MIVVSDSASEGLSRKLAEALSAQCVGVEYKRFPDGEAYVRVLADVKGKEALLVHNLYPDERIVEFMLLCDALRESKAAKIGAVIPYLGYARQDKVFKQGEPISARAIAKLVELYADYAVTVDLHKSESLAFFSIPAFEVSATRAIGAFFRDMKLNNPLVVAPDRGAACRAEAVAAVLGCGWTFLNKKRIDSKTVEIDTGNVDVKNKDALIVDDLVSTGGTVALATSKLKERGARRVYVACTHALFVGNARQKIEQAGCDGLFSTDTIENPTSKITVVKALADTIKNNFL